MTSLRGGDDAMMRLYWTTCLGIVAAGALGCSGASSKPVQNAPIDPATGKEAYINDPKLQGHGQPIPAAPKMPDWLKNKGPKK
jgi:hypothetical protein